MKFFKYILLINFFILLPLKAEELPTPGKAKPASSEEVKTLAEELNESVNKDNVDGREEIEKISNNNSSTPKINNTKSRRPSFLPSARSDNITPNLLPTASGGQTAANDSEEIEIMHSGTPKRGLQLFRNHPSNREVSMVPGDRYSGGGDLLRIIMSQIGPVVINMPVNINSTTDNQQDLEVKMVPNSVNMVQLTVKNNRFKIIPFSMIDHQGAIWNFEVVIVPTDLAIEYPRSIIVSRKYTEDPVLGNRNPLSIINALPLEDAITEVVDGKNRSDSYEVDFKGANYMMDQKYAAFFFEITSKDGRSSLSTKDLGFSLWANNIKIGGMKKESKIPYNQRQVYFTVSKKLSQQATKERGMPVLKLAVLVKIKLQDLENWKNSFIIVQNNKEFTLKNFPSFIRDYRASVDSYVDIFDFAEQSGGE